MARKVAEGTSVAWLNADNPNATDGEGYYEVLKDNEHELDESGHPIFTNTEVEFGKKLENTNDNFVYASKKAKGGEK